eukprot:CAMPEP_0177601982 /NCGR_PEP_ID=MMETSP0419_2-20121207/14602_1 /TAXON_ID=582737 /ORGANISM="Tetraselmis sp., Strain GSL018" /LENGTH=133 /DNA_ID=CAMNT_0019095389 /DNA_START=1191 /DNA_END=1593 /DNA_ORIENTATION=+
MAILASSVALRIEDAGRRDSIRIMAILASSVALSELCSAFGLAECLSRVLANLSLKRTTFGVKDSARNTLVCLGQDRTGARVCEMNPNAALQRSALRVLENIFCLKASCQALQCDETGIGLRVPELAALSPPK